MKKFLLPNGFSIHETVPDVFWKLVDPYIHKLFDDDSLVFNLRDHLSDQENKTLKTLQAGFICPYKLHLAVKEGEDLVGWSFGYQDSNKSFYMQNSAVLPAYRRHGIYSFLMQSAVERLVDLKFEKIWSRHMLTNNSIIIPKLKYGFTISGFELNDVFGNLVHLSYYADPFHQRIIDFRTGHLRPDEKIKQVFSL